MGRFAQADSIIPGPGNPIAWDRFAYSGNNPINYNDPTGYLQKETDDSGLPIEAIIYQLQTEYDWIIKEEEKWNARQLFEVWYAAIAIRHSIASVREDNGINWMRTYFGGTNFFIGGWNETMLRSCVGPSAHEVRFVSNFENLRFRTKTTTGMIIHELGHVLDNRMGPNSLNSSVIGGGGPADELVRFIGGDVTIPLRFWGVTYIPDKNSFLDDYEYGNNSSADYFAQTFAVLMVDKGKEPELAGLWLTAYLQLLP